MNQKLESLLASMACMGIYAVTYVINCHALVRKQEAEFEDDIARLPKPNKDDILFINPLTSDDCEMVIVSKIIERSIRDGPKKQEKYSIY